MRSRDKTPEELKNSRPSPLAFLSFFQSSILLDLQVKQPAIELVSEPQERHGIERDNAGCDSDCACE